MLPVVVQPGVIACALIRRRGVAAPPTGRVAPPTGAARVGESAAIRLPALLFVVGEFNATARGVPVEIGLLLRPDAVADDDESRAKGPRTTSTTALNRKK